MEKTAGSAPCGGTLLPTLWAFFWCFSIVLTHSPAPFLSLLPAMPELISLLHLLFFVWLYRWLWQKSRDNLLRFYLRLGFPLKIGAGIGVGLLYQWHYQGGDTLYFFEQASRLVEASEGNLWQYTKLLLNFEAERVAPLREDRSLLLIQVLSFLVLISGKNYWVCSAYFSLFSFAGTAAAAQSWLSLLEQNAKRTKDTLLSTTSKNVRALGIAFFLFPSVLFWSSGILKEALLVGALGFIWAFFLQKTHLWQGGNLAKNALGFFLIGFLIFLLWKIKFYYIGAWLGVLMSYGVVFWAEKLFFRSDLKLISPTFFQNRPSFCLPFWGKIVLFIGVGLFGLALLPFLHPKFKPDRLLRVVVISHNQIAAATPAHNLVRYQDLEPTWTSLVRNAPVAFWAGLFRPFLWENKKQPFFSALLHPLAAIENWALLFLFLCYLKNKIEKGRSQWAVLHLSLWVFILLMALFLALSAPNLGSLVRYKVGFLPYLVFILLKK